MLAEFWLSNDYTTINIHNVGSILSEPAKLDSVNSFNFKTPSPDDIVKSARSGGSMHHRQSNFTRMF
jgi:hypothetical protein